MIHLPNDGNVTQQKSSSINDVIAVDMPDEDVFD